MNRSELVKTLELLKPALATNNMVPIFQNFSFKEGQVTAYNDSIAIIGPAEVVETCAIHGNTLLGLLSNSNTEEVEISLNGDTALIKSGKTVSKLPFLPEENFIFEIPTTKPKFKLPFSSSIADAFRICLETVSDDETQAALQGITLDGDRLYSCNGDMLSRINLKHAGKWSFMSTAFCEAVLKLWSSLEMTSGQLLFTDDWIEADFDTWSVFGRVLEISTPIDFEALIRKTIKAKIPLQAVPEELFDALARARVLSDPESQKTTASIEKGKLRLHTETHMGEVNDTLSFKGHPDTIAKVNAAHLHQALKNCDTLAFHENCVVLQKDNLLQLVSNMS